ncbi:MAG: hypothetical protein HKN19_10445 [Halioglobus sp.]|nr:hypothetical protein [Halioglobus sp.]
MANSRDLVDKVAQGIEASSRTSPTPPGQSEGKREERDLEGHVEAINQVFALFRLNYHNQYYAAYPDGEQLGQIKKLWLESLADFSVEQILLGAKHAIENSEYLPTLHRMLDCCRDAISDIGLPSAKDAYREACVARSPRSAQVWSHPAVYLAGRDSDWFFLANNPESMTWPVFRRHYEDYCARVLKGEVLEVPEPASLERDAPEPLSADEQLAQLAKLREEAGL